MPFGKELIDIAVGKTRGAVDIKILDKTPLFFRFITKILRDKAYVGELLTNTSHKKPREPHLPPDQKRENKVKIQKKM